MKTILVPTDFSPAANNAARYALHLAKGIKAGITLCHAMLVPVDAPGAAQVAWPLEDYESIKKDTTKQLQLQLKNLELHVEEDAAYFPKDFQPSVDYTSEVGPVTDVIREVIDEHNIPLVVMGMSGAGNLTRLFIGSSSRDVIANATCPVMLIPAQFTYKPIRKIAFATDLSKGDIAVIHSLVGLAHAFDAEIQINHISDKKYEDGEGQYLADAFMAELCRKVTYPYIRYHHVKSMDVDHGLDWLYEHSKIDILVMVHRQHGWLKRLFEGSHTQKLAKHITLPLLVYPPEYGAAI
jgi:nucleotide-binding universal stress UspA family protein